MLIAVTAIAVASKLRLAAILVRDPVSASAVRGFTARVIADDTHFFSHALREIRAPVKIVERIVRVRSEPCLNCKRARILTVHESYQPHPGSCEHSVQVSSRPQWIRVVSRIPTTHSGPSRHGPTSALCVPTTHKTIIPIGNRILHSGPSRH